MTKPVTVDAEAAEELADAARWYGRRRPGLGRDLIAAVRRAFATISENPHAFAVRGSVAGAIEQARGRVAAIALEPSC